MKSLIELSIVSKTQHNNESSRVLNIGLSNVYTLDITLLNLD